MTATHAEVLDRAAKILENGYWIRGRLMQRNDFSGRPVGFCLMGAVMQATKEIGGSLKECVCCHEGAEAIRMVLRRKHGWTMNPEAWNDRAAATKGEVVAVLRDAADLLREQEERTSERQEAIYRYAVPSEPSYTGFTTEIQEPSYYVQNVSWVVNSIDEIEWNKVKQMPAPEPTVTIENDVEEEDREKVLAGV